MGNRQHNVVIEILRFEALKLNLYGCFYVCYYLFGKLFNFRSCRYFGMSQTCCSPKKLQPFLRPFSLIRNVFFTQQQVFVPALKISFYRPNYAVRFVFWTTILKIKRLETYLVFEFYVVQVQTLQASNTALFKRIQLLL